MTLDIQRAAAQRMRRVIIGLVVLVLVLVAGIIGLVVGRGGDSSSPSSAPASPAPSSSSDNEPSSAPTETADGGYVAPSAWVTLPEAKGKRDGLPVGFPHTVEGAAAAAVAAVRAGWTWDPDAAERAAGVYSVPSEAADMKKAARESTAASRTSVGLPGTGELPAGAHMSVAPIGVQWSDASADQVTVSVLSRIVYTTESGAAEKSQVIASSSLVVWADGDWHTKSGGNPTAPEPFDLGTEGFNSAGWRAIQEGDTR